MKASMTAAGAIVVADTLAGCAATNRLRSCDVNYGVTVPVAFRHGVASGDPTANSVILWTRVTPFSPAAVLINWEVATDRTFKNVTHSGADITTAEKDYTLKLDIVGLKPNTRYYYQFRANNAVSLLGMTKTLPTGAVDHIKMAVMSCSDYSSGYFHAYDAVAYRDDIDLVLHLGDYIYEYSQALSPFPEGVERAPMPPHELLVLNDYRTRYNQYRQDKKLQQLHARKPFVCVWDDHEFANNTWRQGAQNHNADEGNFSDRSSAARQAYFEWLPVRGKGEQGAIREIDRSFELGDLVKLHMLDTRFVGRDKQLEYRDFYNKDRNHFDQARFNRKLNDSSRTIVGKQQLGSLKESIRGSDAKWQVLGQQILMGRYPIPGAIALRRLDSITFERLDKLAQIDERVKQGERVSSDARAFYQAGKSELTPEALTLLALPDLPLNLDAWDGYPAERSQVLDLMAESGSGFVVLAGDTHNAWASNLMAGNGSKAGLEFGTHSVTSPGIDGFFNYDSKKMSHAERTLMTRVKDLEYVNVRGRGFMLVEFSRNKVRTEWHFVSDVKKPNYKILTDHQHAIEADRSTLTMKSAS